MSYESRAYDQLNDDGFGPDPVVVLVVEGTHDVSRLVNLLNGGQPVVEQIQLGQRIVNQVRRDQGGRAALKLLAEHGGPDFSPPAIPKALTARVVHIVGQLAAGHQQKQIARGLDLSQSTVGMHLHRALRALGLDSREQLVALCVHLGLVEPPEVAS